jgi:hypothetical protein
LFSSLPPSHQGQTVKDQCETVIPIKPEKTTHKIL